VAELTVMTWNVQNLLAVGHPDGLATEDEYRVKLEAVAGVIDRVAPDVVALQEVGPPQVLADLNAMCAVDFDHRLTGSEDRRGIRVALMSPRRLSRRRNLQSFPPGVLPVQHHDTVFDPATISATSRGILSATVRAGGETVTVVTCHLKSKLITYDRQPGVVAGSEVVPNDEGERLRYAGYALARRGAEAMTCRAALDETLTAPGDQVGAGPGTGRESAVVL
jgi:endonuclease/exonuclease/phosphatase family metal-dependent hydrolase